MSPITGIRFKPIATSPICRPIIVAGPDGGLVKFEIDAFRKHYILNSLDEIGLTHQKSAKIVGYEQKAKAARPWA